MVIGLVPFAQSPSFKYIRKMSMVQLGEGKSTPLNHQYPMNTSQSGLINEMRNNRTLMEEFGQPVEKKILSGLTRDMMDILMDETASDDTKANLYLNAINRYLTYSGKVNALIPIATMRRKVLKSTPESVGISPQHEYNPSGKHNKPTRDLFSDLVEPIFNEFNREEPVPSTSNVQKPFFFTPARRLAPQEVGREGEDGRGGAPPPPPLPSLAATTKTAEDAATAWGTPRISKIFSESDDSESDDESEAVEFESPESNRLYRKRLQALNEQRATPPETIIEKVVPVHRVKAKKMLSRIVHSVPKSEIDWNNTGHAIINNTAIATPLSQLIQNNLNKPSSKKQLDGSVAFDNILLKYRVMNPSGVAIHPTGGDDDEDNWGDTENKSGSGRNKIVYWEV
jgi:hypothetical protein